MTGHCHLIYVDNNVHAPTADICLEIITGTQRLTCFLESKHSFSIIELMWTGNIIEDGFAKNFVRALGDILFILNN